MNRFLVATLVFTLGCSGPGERTEAEGPTVSIPTETATEASGVRTFRVGDQVGELEAQTLEGKPFRLSQLRGKAVLVNVWATWCGPCRAEIPELQRLHDEYAARDLTVLGVSVDVAGARPDVIEFLRERDVSYPNVHDPDGVMADAFDAFALPTSILLDDSGKVVWKETGVISLDDPELLRALEVAAPRGAES